MSTPHVEFNPLISGNSSRDVRDVRDLSQAQSHRKPVSGVEEILDSSVEYQILKRMSGESDEARPVTEAGRAKRAHMESSYSHPDALMSEITHTASQSLSVQHQSPSSQSINAATFKTQRTTTLSIESSRDTVQQADPIVLDLDGSGIRTTGVKEGVLFDIDGDGKLDRTSFVSGNSAFLALDRNGNGVIDNGKELFGDQHGHANGYEALREFDDNGDGVIDAQDSVFDRLRLFQMDDQGKQVLTPLKQAGVESLNLQYVEMEKALNRHDFIAESSTFTRSDGSTGATADLMLGFDHVV
jgi:hypothetical protein